VAIGQKATIANVVRKLEEHGVGYTIVVATTSSDPQRCSSWHLRHAHGEYFRDRGEDALIVYDDLTKQAWPPSDFLLLRRPPGREAYPGDVLPALPCWSAAALAPITLAFTKGAVKARQAPSQRCLLLKQLLATFLRSFQPTYFDYRRSDLP
jgi:F-type H+-transporting ATPase subunit alpha